MERINLLKQQEQLDSRHANTTAIQIYETAARIKFKLYMHRKYHKRNINSCKRWIDSLFPPSKGEYTTYIIHKQLHRRKTTIKKKTTKKKTVCTTTPKIHSALDLIF